MVKYFQSLVKWWCVIVFETRYHYAAEADLEPVVFLLIQHLLTDKIT